MDLTPAERVEFVGPFESYRVVVDGWEGPFLEAHMRPGDIVDISLDRRYGLEVPIADAERLVPFLAHTIAVAAGYPSHPDRDGLPTSLPHSQPRRLIGLDWAEEDAVEDLPG